MQERVSKQVNLEDEILKKVEEQFNTLKQIIDEQKEHAKKIIKNLEQVQSYRPPPQDLTSETLDELANFQEDVRKMIDQINKDIQSGNHINVLNKKQLLGRY